MKTEQKFLVQVLGWIPPWKSVFSVPPELFTALSVSASFLGANILCETDASRSTGITWITSAITNVFMSALIPNVSIIPMMHLSLLSCYPITAHYFSATSLLPLPYQNFNPLPPPICLQYYPPLSFDTYIPCSHYGQTSVATYFLVKKNCMYPAALLSILSLSPPVATISPPFQHIWLFCRPSLYYISNAPPPTANISIVP